MGRTKESLEKALVVFKDIRERFHKELLIPGTTEGVNIELEKATRVEDYIDMAELITTDALTRNESCGGHFREESQTEEGEAKRDDANYMYVGAWEYKGTGEMTLHKEDLNYENIEVKSRNYK